MPAQGSSAVALHAASRKAIAAFLDLTATPVAKSPMSAGIAIVIPRIDARPAPNTARDIFIFSKIVGGKSLLQCNQELIDRSERPLLL
jgi:hypothetical protein